MSTPDLRWTLRLGKITHVLSDHREDDLERMAQTLMKHGNREAWEVARRFAPGGFSDWDLPGPRGHWL